MLSTCIRLSRCLSTARNGSDAAHCWNASLLIARQHYEKGVFHVSVLFFQHGAYGSGLLFESFALQICEPAAAHDVRDFFYHGVACGEYVVAFQRVIVLSHVFRAFYLQCRHGSAVGSCHFAVAVQAHMQYHIVVCLVVVVVVAVPVRCVFVYFHVSGPHCVSYFYLRVEEVWTFIPVVVAGIYHFHLLSRCGSKVRFQYLVLPDVMNDMFHCCRFLFLQSFNKYSDYIVSSCLPA